MRGPQMQLGKRLPLGLVERAKREGFVIWDCGMLAGLGDPDEVHLYSDQGCKVCGHAPCPCCETFCDHSECILPEDTPCLDNRCTYDSAPRFFVASGSVWGEDPSG